MRVEYAPDAISLDALLTLYYDAIDPTSFNRQGFDVGAQYRTGVYYTDEADKAVILRSIARLQETLAEPVAIEVLPLENFYPAEEYHQKYLEKNPNGYCHIGASKFEKARGHGGKE